MISSERIRLVKSVLGLTCTASELCDFIGCNEHEFMTADAKDVGGINSPFSFGWFAARTCSSEYIKDEILLSRKGDMQFWFGAAAGRNLEEQLLDAIT